MARKTKSTRKGIAVIFARTETECFFENLWYAADALLFVKGRIKFFHVSGIQGGASGAPSVFVAYGKEDALWDCLRPPLLRLAPRQLLLAADSKLYGAKRAGRNRVALDPNAICT